MNVASLSPVASVCREVGEGGMEEERDGGKEGGGREGWGEEGREGQSEGRRGGEKKVGREKSKGNE